jgi:hypothetical protein
MAVKATSVTSEIWKMTKYAANEEKTGTDSSQAA